MLKKLLALICCMLVLTVCSALAEADAVPTLVITEDMQFYAGPGTHYVQQAYHNHPPKAGETAQVIGRTDDWLLVCYTGYWWEKTSPVWYYLPLSAAPTFADAPELNFTAEPNALAVESARVYADPEGLTYDLYIHPEEGGLTVLALYGDMAYVDAVNPYGHRLRGFISINDLAQVPGASSPEHAPEGTALLLSRKELSLTYIPADSSIAALTLADGSTALQYDTLLPDEGRGVALATISASGETTSCQVFRQRDGEEESTVEFLLPSVRGFSYAYCRGSDMTPIYETWFDFTGQERGGATLKHTPGETIDTLGTARFRIGKGRAEDVAATGESVLPLQITVLESGKTLLEIGPEDHISCAAESGGFLAVPVCSGQTGEKLTHLLVFDAQPQLVSETIVSGYVYDAQLVPTGEDSTYLLARLDDGTWLGYGISLSDGLVSPTGLTLSIPVNRTAALLAAKNGQVLLATGGVDTQLILTDGESQLLAADAPGMLINAASDGQTASLLLWQNGRLYWEQYALQLP